MNFAEEKSVSYMTEWEQYSAVAKGCWRLQEQVDCDQTKSQYDQKLFNDPAQPNQSTQVSSGNSCKTILGVIFERHTERSQEYPLLTGFYYAVYISVGFQIRRHDSIDRFVGNDHDSSDPRAALIASATSIDVVIEPKNLLQESYLSNLQVS